MSVFSELVSQEAAQQEILRAAFAARALLSKDANLPILASSGTSSPDTNTSTSNKTKTELITDTVSTSAMTHAWLFTGPPGSGRSLAARAFAACLQCENDTNLGCGECSSCKAVMSKNHPDVDTITTELVTITVEQVRTLVARSYQAPANGKWRVFIVEDADRMLQRTTNVLLKAIEEPAPRTVWVLCTTAVADVLPTIRSRCRNINLVTPDTTGIAELLCARDGVDFQEALVAAKAAQSHIGVARALATDPFAANLRKNTLDTLLTVKGVGDAVIAAAALADENFMLSNANTDSRETSRKSNGSKSAKEIAEVEQAAAEQARIAKMEALGLDPAGKVPVSLRSQVNVNADDEKRKKTRRNLDRLDRELIYLTAFFRDVLVVQLQAEVDLVNADYAQEITERAGMFTLTQTLTALDALAQARVRLQQNLNPVGVLETALLAIRPQ